jgi:hypothetical protein
MNLAFSPVKLNLCLRGNAPNTFGALLKVHATQAGL